MTSVPSSRTSATGVTRRRFSVVTQFLAALFVFALALTAAPESVQAQNLIKQPGAHNRYAWELEVQGVIRTHAPYGRNCCFGYRYGGWAGTGPGVRVNIPFMHNGPIDSINNNIGISFGGSTTWHPTPGRDAVVLNVPVAFQWNFYFTDVISVIGEAGLNTPLTFYGGRTYFDIEPLFQGGGRFQWGKVGLIARVGWPLLSVGANFQF